MTDDYSPAQFDPAEVARLMREALDRDRGYASYGQWPPDKAVAELDHARVLIAFLAVETGLMVEKVISNGRDDPPDCTAVLKDGSKVGIEVTELVDGAMVGGHARRLKAMRQGRPIPADAAAPDDVALWTHEPLTAELNRLLKGKDISPEKRKGGPYDRYIVVITTDETMITVDLLNKVAVDGFEVAHIDEAYVIVSYEPAFAESFPEGRPVVRLPLRPISRY